jgi:thiol-disulfide isomerase/thioredoxin
VVVNLWAPWCQPCKAEAPLLAGRAKQCGAQVHFVALSTDADLPAARKGAAQLGLEVPVGVASPGQLALLDRALDGAPLPSTLGFDAQGRLQFAVTGKVTPAALERLAPCPGK